MNRKSAPIHLIVHSPQTEEGKSELSRRTALIHADMVNHRLQGLDCPAEQKVTLLDAIIETVQKNECIQSRQH